MISPTADKEDCQRTVISGLGGVGKTQIALEAAFRVRARCPDCHVFWVPAINTTTFENGYHEIGQKLSIQNVENDKTAIKLLVRAALSQSSDNWLLIIDNADDATLFGETSEVTSLRGYLPFSLKGLDLQRKVLGAEHFVTLKIMHSLSLAFNGQGCYKEAEQIAGRHLDH